MFPCPVRRDSTAAWLATRGFNQPLNRTLHEFRRFKCNVADWSSNNRGLSTHWCLLPPSCCSKVRAELPSLWQIGQFSSGFGTTSVYVDSSHGIGQCHHPFIFEVHRLFYLHRSSNEKKRSRLGMKSAGTGRNKREQLFLSRWCLPLTNNECLSHSFC